MDDECERLFAYGTLQNANVQREQFGRLLRGEPDVLTGFRIGRVAISDPEVVRKSGESHHPALIATGCASQRVEGTLFSIASDELAAADDYEAGEYVRRRVTLESGRQAWVYVAATDPPKD